MQIIHNNVTCFVFCKMYFILFAKRIVYASLEKGELLWSLEILIYNMCMPVSSRRGEV